MVQRFNSTFKHILLLDTLAALGAASIEEVVNVLQQLQNEAFEEEEKQQQQISNEQFQELLNGINFDEPIEETKNYVVNQTTKNLSKEQTLMNLQKKNKKKTKITLHLFWLLSVQLKKKNRTMKCAIKYLVLLLEVLKFQR